ncbi:MAG: hypothetical protein GX284_07045 [Clostridiales bacterium]|uniref:hypothetical protein n=1 Tax=Roseburia sp. MSJ-14 TaxID=2841514 RepID=UPI0016BB51ED|nr:hypothetical protein [Roseburia sp. MSJ-14]MBU5472453.1 hypothetical protein [Roseburia sp. MSJ-14]NLK77460.1 hypothetical protein [Clostridiales bacterium]
MEQVSLFENLKFCSICRRPLPLDYEKEMCPQCIENQLFNEVKEYIRSRDVTEYQVAEHFKIPHYKVKRWIDEGRIEYKEQDNKIMNQHCSKCGAPISFGNLCQKCYKEKYNTKVGYAPLKSKDGDNEKIRFLD